MWDLPGPGLQPVSPALAGGFLTTAPPGKSSLYIFTASEACNSYLREFINFFLYVFWGGMVKGGRII